MQIITSQVPYTSKARNAEHDYLFNKLVEAITKEFATKHNFLAYHQRMTAALADENASYTRTTKYVDTDTLVQKDNARDNLFRRLKLHLQSVGSQNPTTLPYTENTAAVRDIVDKLESDHYAPSVEQVGAAQLVADLKAANNDFDALYTARADERYARNTSAPDMKVARAAMEAAYADVADIVNALYIQSTVLAPDEETLAEVTAHDGERPHLAVHAGTLAPRRGQDDRRHHRHRHAGRRRHRHARTRTRRAGRRRGRRRKPAVMENGKWKIENGKGGRKAPFFYYLCRRTIITLKK